MRQQTDQPPARSQQLVTDVEKDRVACAVAEREQLALAGRGLQRQRKWRVGENVIYFTKPALKRRAALEEVRLHQRAPVVRRRRQQEGDFRQRHKRWLDLVADQVALGVAPAPGRRQQEAAAAAGRVHDYRPINSWQQAGHLLGDRTRREELAGAFAETPPDEMLIPIGQPFATRVRSDERAKQSGERRIVTQPGRQAGRACEELR